MLVGIRSRCDPASISSMLIIPEKEVPEFKQLLVAYYEDRSSDIFLFMKEKCVKTVSA